MEIKSSYEYYIKKNPRFFILSLLLLPAPSPFSPFCNAEGNEAKFVDTDLNMTIRQILFP